MKITIDISLRKLSFLLLQSEFSTSYERISPSNNETGYLSGIFLNTQLVSLNAEPKIVENYTKISENATMSHFSEHSTQGRNK